MKELFVDHYFQYKYNSVVNKSKYNLQFLLCLRVFQQLLAVPAFPLCQEVPRSPVCPGHPCPLVAQMVREVPSHLSDQAFPGEMIYDLWIIVVV